MPELFIELFGEEIPARLQARAADELVRLVREGLVALSPASLRPFFGPRRIALGADIAAAVPASSSVERGPRVTAPEQALAGFVRKHGATREALRREGDFWVLDKASPALDAMALVAAAMPGLLRRFAWPKSMRWGGTSAFTWIRPLRRIVCLLDGAVVPFDLATEGDDGHGLASGALTEGHRVHAPGTVAVSGLANWQASLQARYVMADAADRVRLVRNRIDALAAAHGLMAVEDTGLLDEVAGLVEWPVPLLGRIDDAFMDLPPEVMQVSMRVNQRYFALRDAQGHPAPWFAFAANVDAEDDGAAIVAGNERVLRARFSDARHFWDLDRRTKLVDRVAALDGVTFHAKLGTQGDRVRRLVRLAGVIAPMVGADPALAERAALLCKADLTTGMVGEFPELQGVMGGYYAQYDGEDAHIVQAVRDHYLPRGTEDVTPADRVAMAVAVADKLDQITGLFIAGHKPTGSGDPYALRRAAIGILRIALERAVTLPLESLVDEAVDQHGSRQAEAVSIKQFLWERMHFMMRARGVRHDVVSTILFNTGKGDFLELHGRASELQAFLETEDGAGVLAAYKRGTNILRIEEAKDGFPHHGGVHHGLLLTESEQALHCAVSFTDTGSETTFADKLRILATLRRPLDAFLDQNIVNDPDPELRANRLRLLSRLRDVMQRVCDFSKLEASTTSAVTSLTFPTPHLE